MTNPLDDPTPLEVLAWEFVARVAAGERPTLAEYIDRHPELAGEICALFPSLVLRADPGVLDRTGLEVWPEGSQPPAPLGDDPAATRAMPPAKVTPLVDRIPTIPGYEVLGLLGRGGMGIVYQARQVRLDRIVALKMILSSEHTDPNGVERFLAEAVAIAKVQHRNVVQIFHVDQIDGLPYFAMEFVVGGNLAEKLSGEPLPTREVVRLGIGLASGVAEAHRLGIVHRDLKPANVLLSLDGTPKVADFGLAKVIGVDSGMTRPDLILGSPCYMAPEQASGHAQDVGPAADIYALGALLYEMLTGRPPFRGATVLGTLDQVKHSEPVPPSRLVPTVPRDLETICLKCLRKEPTKRYTSADALADDLERFDRGEPILARRTGSIMRTWRWCRRNPAIASLTSVAAGLLVVLAVGSTIAAARLRQERASTEQAEELRRAEMVRSLLIASPDGVPILLDSLKAYHGLAQALTHLQKSLATGGAPVETRVRAATVLTSLGDDHSAFLIDRIGTIPAEEAGNVIQALATGLSENRLHSLREASDRAEPLELRARLAAVLLALGSDQAARSMFDLASDPAGRIALIHAVSAWHGDLRSVPDRLRHWPPHVRSGLIVALGLMRSARRSSHWPHLVETLQDLYRDADDAGTHSAASWTLRQWGEPLPIIAPAQEARPGQGWHVNALGLTMIEVAPGTLDLVEPDLRPGSHRLIMPRPFLMSDSEVPLSLWLDFAADPDAERPQNWQVDQRFAPPSEDCPTAGVSWEDAVLFCNWMSRADGRTPCYERDDTRAEQWRCRLEADGYRLPTFAEWEYACRARSEQRFAVGDRPDELALFAHWGTQTTAPVRLKPPNPFGLFDMNGNVWEWTEDVPSYEARNEPIMIEPVGWSRPAVRPIRGGGFDSGSNDFLMSLRLLAYPINIRIRSIGFRVAITAREDARTDQLIEALVTSAARRAVDPPSRGNAAALHAELGAWHAVRADITGQANHLDRAALDFARGIEYAPANLELPYFHALILAAAGKHADYRQACTSIADRVGAGRSWLDFQRVFRSCSLMPNALADNKSPLDLVSEPIAARPAPSWMAYVVGLAEYRAGHFDKAIEDLTQAEKDTNWQAALLTWPVLAMAHQRLGHPAKARRWLEKAQATDANWYKPALMGAGRPRELRWWDGMEFRLLVAEAAALIGP